mmetsp:Transcript_34875/g.39767  ORF Transcript_34875/g.39767 Transcript_34875/m.39767 type:complete len:330 (+) Transcript_34875:52-1041(+)
MGKSIRSLNVSSAYHPVEEGNAGPVAYDSTDWCQVLFQCFGSAWPRVVPFCIMNVLIMITVTLLKQNKIINLGITKQTHTIAGMIVAFLLVSRIKTALDRYSTCRNDLNTMYLETGELIQNAVVQSHSRSACSENLDEKSCQWRNEVAYRALILLRTSVAVVEYFSKGLPGWKYPELSGYEAAYATPSDSWERDYPSNPHDDYSNTTRIPFRMAYLLRKTISAHDVRLIVPINVRHEISLLNSIDKFMAGFYGMRKFVTTPVPFPLVQMCRTIILIYVFTIPLVFLKIEESQIVWDCISIFLITYGFMGLELVAIELDDPFGDDENDFE